MKWVFKTNITNWWTNWKSGHFKIPINKKTIPGFNWLSKEVFDYLQPSGPLCEIFVSRSSKNIPIKRKEQTNGQMDGQLKSIELMSPHPGMVENSVYVKLDE